MPLPVQQETREGRACTNLPLSLIDCIEQEGKEDETYKTSGSAASPKQAGKRRQPTAAEPGNHLCVGLCRGFSIGARPALDRGGQRRYGLFMGSVRHQQPLAGRALPGSFGAVGHPFGALRLVHSAALACPFATSFWQYRGSLPGSPGAISIFITGCREQFLTSSFC